MPWEYSQWTYWSFQESRFFQNNPRGNISASDHAAEVHDNLLVDNYSGEESTNNDLKACGTLKYNRYAEGIHMIVDPTLVPILEYIPENYYQVFTLTTHQLLYVYSQLMHMVPLQTLYPSTTRPHIHQIAIPS